MPQHHHRKAIVRDRWGSIGDAVLEHIMSGDVGIFWVDQGQLIMASVPLADGIDDGRFVNGPYNHEPYWPSNTVAAIGPHRPDRREAAR
jgi:hypothetical protein